MGGGDWAPENPDDFAHCTIRDPKDIRDRYVPNFFFGCEAEDPLIAWAFNSRVNPLGARLNAVLGSDIGHWDVPDMEEIAAEAYELVEQGVLSEQDFRDFTFANPIKLWASLNPDFFKGTAIEAAVATGDRGASSPDAAGDARISTFVRKRSPTS